ncbi:YggS family pyridoxal phosphate-dependent enzyme [Microlunatus sp. GCM10028923]|uniref:YggS family pyridoxal phosphate-dependent enzyme n=1 Tax=Microlunatus sp. GCM10028923 TaxID=3273400 RepID=UPI00360849E4
MATIVENLAAVRRKIERACAAAGRDPSEVRLLPVSKTHPPELIMEAYRAGERLFGENRPQELAAKAEQLRDVDDLKFAAIGHLQTNKAKLITDWASEFHALDSIKVAEVLDRRLQQAGRSLDVFLQVNSSGEDQKFGLPPEEVAGFAAALADYSSLRVRGLMTLAIFSDDQVRVGACFALMRDLQARLRDDDAAVGSYDELSMGMSGDFELAIAYGATTVRVGQSIFGTRLNPDDYWNPAG